jgi:hypothetical protein
MADAFKADTLNSQSPDTIDFGTGMTIRSISLKSAGLKVIFTTNRNDHILQAKGSQPSGVRGDD